MIKFFRNIRQSLIMENKTSRYLKYAIGEIVLVVIGILLALQINIWNQERKRKQLEHVLLEQLKSEVLTVYGDMYTDYNVLSQGRNSHFNIMDYLDGKIDYNDSLAFDFHFITQDEYIYPKEAVYSRIKEEGLDIIENDTIRNLVQSLFESLFPRLSKGNSFTPDITETFNSYYLEHFKLNNDYTFQYNKVYDNDTLSGRIFRDEDKYPITFEENGVKRYYTIGYLPLDNQSLREDHKFRQLLYQTFRYRNYKQFRYRSAKEVIKMLTQLIDKELDIQHD